MILLHSTWVFEQVCYIISCISCHSVPLPNTYLATILKLQAKKLLLFGLVALCLGAVLWPLMFLVPFTPLAPLGPLTIPFELDLDFSSVGTAIMTLLIEVDNSI